MEVGLWPNRTLRFLFSFLNMPSACSNITGDLPQKQAITKTESVLLHGDAALALALGAGLSTVRTWRAKRLIPFIKTGHKSISYSLPKVLAALERLTVYPRGAKKGGI